MCHRVFLLFFIGMFWVWPVFGVCFAVFRGFVCIQRPFLNFQRGAPLCLALLMNPFSALHKVRPICSQNGMGIRTLLPLKCSWF